MNIRRATRDDLEMMAEAPAREFCSFVSPKIPIYNAKRVREFLGMLIDKHFVAIAEEAGSPAGALGALLHGHLWNPDLRCASECFWWVQPGHRGGWAAYLLIKEYADYIEREGFAKGNLCLLEKSVLTRSPLAIRALARLGFVAGEHTYIKERAVA